MVHSLGPSTVWILVAIVPWNLTVSIDVESRWHVVVAMEIDVSNA